MPQRDLQELEQAARTIVAVFERNRVSDETTEEQRAAFHFVSDEVKEKSPTISPEAKRNTALSFTAQEIEEMPNDSKNFLLPRLLSSISEKTAILTKFAYSFAESGSPQADKI